MTPFVDVMLAPADAAALSDLHTACCEASRSTSPLCLRLLPAALSEGHAPDEDVCAMTPMTCDDEVRACLLLTAKLP